MSFLRNCISTAAMLAVSVSFSPLRASAENISFNLPVETHWNNVVLEPGQYRLSIPQSASWPQLIELTKDGKTVGLMAIVETSTPKNEASSLRLERAGGTSVVTDLKLGPAGKAFHFPIPNAVRHELTAGKLASQTVTLVPSGK